MARTGLQAALRSSAKGALPTPETGSLKPEPVERLAVQPSRMGKVNVTGYFPPEVKASLRLVQAKRGGTIQDILAEALNDLFAKYRVPESAPRERSE
jgi:multidrug efflux pump subunit AcrA (membrane-fusion protein)